MSILNILEFGYAGQTLVCVLLYDDTQETGSQEEVCGL